MNPGRKDGMGEMLLYSHHTSPRLSYILELIGKEIFNEPFLHTTDETVFLEDRGPKLNYSPARLSSGEFFIQNHQLLFESGIHDYKISCFSFQDQTVFFQTEGDYPFDIFAACFYLLSRYEEYLPFEPDHYGRFPYQASLAFRENFLEIPQINYWLEQFKQILREKFPELVFRVNDFRYIPTYDIDIAYSYQFKGFFRNMGGFARSFFKGEWSRLLDRWDVLFQKKKDPFDVYEWLDSLHLYCRIRPYYFFLLAHRQKGVDKNISPKRKGMRTLISYHAEGYQVGIHPSWQSGDNEQVLRREVDSLEDITGNQIKYSRQHYIRMTLPETYQGLIRAGIEKDFSMGYGGANGFRASIASPFYWYDLKMEKKTGLMLFPFCFMDSSSFYGSRLTAKEAFAELMGYYRRIKRVNGLMITIWHNQFLGTDPMFSGWKELYEVFLKDEIYWDA